MSKSKEDQEREEWEKKPVTVKAEQIKQNDGKYIDVVHITADGGVIKKMLRRGEGAKPEEGQDVFVHYEGRLTNGNVFDSSEKHGEPLKFSMGQG